eukprot:13318383-Ditylum_brightwellii.AAC.1
MSSTGPNYARKLHLVMPWEILVLSQWSLVDICRQVLVPQQGLAQALVPCYGLGLVYKYLLDCILKNSFFPWYHRNSYTNGSETSMLLLS